MPDPVRVLECQVQGHLVNPVNNQCLVCDEPVFEPQPRPDYHVDTSEWIERLFLQDSQW